MDSMGTSLTVHAPTAGTQVQSLVRELRFYKSQDRKKKKKKELRLKMDSMDFIPNEKTKGLKWTALSWLTAKFLIFHIFFS